VKWLLLDFLADVQARAKTIYYLDVGPEITPLDAAAPTLSLRENEDRVAIDTGKIALEVGKGPGPLLRSLRRGRKDLLDPSGGTGSYLRLCNGEQQKPQIVLPSTPKPPQIDGRLSEGEWDGAARLDPFRDGVGRSRRGAVRYPRIGAPGQDRKLEDDGDSDESETEETPPRGTTPGCRTTGFLTSDRSFLFFAARMEEPEAASDAKRAGDFVRLLLDLDHDHGAVTALSVRADGGLSASHEDIEGKGWQPAWHAKVGRGRGFWCVEAAVPWASLGGRPEPSSVWGLNFMRCRSARQECPKQESFWVAPHRGTGLYFGHLFFDPAARKAWSSRSLSLTSRAAPMKVTVEERGPVHAVVKVSGTHSDGAGRASGPYEVRIHTYLKSSLLRLQYTYIHTEDPHQWAVEAMGLSLPLRAHVTGVTRSPPSSNIAWVHAVSEQCEFLGAVPRSREEAPKAVKIEGNALRYEIWPASAGIMDMRRTDEKLIDAIARGEHHVTKVDFNHAHSAWRGLGIWFDGHRGVFYEKYFKNNAIGAAWTTDLYLWPHDTGADPAQLAAALQRPMLLRVDPRWVEQTRVLGPLHPSDPRNVPVHETHLDQHLRWWARQEEWTKLSGMWFHGGLLTYYQLRRGRETEEGWSRYLSRYAFHKGYLGEHHAMMLQYLRTGDRTFFDSGAAQARWLRDACTFHLDEPRGWRGARREPSTDPWVGSFLPLCQFLEGEAIYYYLTGDRRTRQVFDDYVRWAADASKVRGTRLRWYGQWLSTLTYGWELTGSAEAERLARWCVDHLLEHQDPTGGWRWYFWEKGDKAGQFGDHNLDGFYLFPALCHYYEHTKDERVKSAILRAAEHQLLPELQGFDESWMLLAPAYAYLWTGDERYVHSMLKKSIGLDKVIRVFIRRYQNGLRPDSFFGGEGPYDLRQMPYVIAALYRYAKKTKQPLPLDVCTQLAR